MTTAPLSVTEGPAKRGLWRYAVATVALVLLPFVLWPSLLTKAASSNFLPHRFCYLNSPGLVWVNVVSDIVIGTSYIWISVTLAWLVHRTRRDIPLSWVFLAFGMFIIACGCTHLMETVTIWVPLYWLLADVKVVTALASLATAIAVPFLVPKTISLLRASKVAAERKLQLEAANAQLLRRSQDATARLAALVEGSEDAIIAYSLDGIITDWNQAATRLYGYSSEEAIGRKVSLLAYPNHVSELKDIVASVAAGNRIQQLETQRRRKDGNLVDVSLSFSPITGPDGTIIGGSNIVRDITSRKRMEEALRRSEERFRLVARATKDAIADWDIASGTIWRSESFWEQFGYPAKKTEPDMAAWRSLIHPEDSSRVWNGLQTALARRDDSYEVEYRFRRADGSYATVLDRSYIVYHESGAPARAISTMTDLSDRRQLEEQFRQAQKMEAIGRLAGGVAHDFNNLLMVITGYAEMMQEQLSAEDDILQKYLAGVLKAAERAAGLTHQLLAFSRKQVLSPRVLDMNAIVEDSSNLVRRLIREDIDLNVSLGKPLKTVKADPGQIVQVLLNLCVNARDAMPKGGKLTIATENISIDAKAARERPALLPGDYVALVVSDTGTGMTAEVRAQIFEPFFTTKESGKGTGLGLSMVYGIVKQSGGYIWVDSKVGRGTSFSLYFPALAVPFTVTITPELTRVEGRGEVILLVEDEESLRKSISDYLGMHGYKVFQASDGDQAVHIASQQRGSIDVLVTDMVLPKLNGAELAREVAKKRPDLLTLYISGYTDRELTDYDTGSSTAEFLQKPFPLARLLERIRMMIVTRESRRRATG